MPAAPEDSAQEQQGNSVYAALARTATRSMALYFSRPVRLFRPSKVSGWHSLRGIATQEGATLTPRYMYRLVKEQGFMIIPRHFVPPMMVNAVLGTILWATYAETSLFLDFYLGAHPLTMAALSGAIAGGMQAICAAPVENVRLVLEGGSSGVGWSHAWKEVFRGVRLESSSIRVNKLHQAREFRHWMREVKGMAGRGWEGWGWGCAKDVCGFSVFFSIFEATRRIAITARAASQRSMQYLTFKDDRGRAYQRHTPRVVHAITLVSGGMVAGLSYEFMCRPWDVSRKVVYVEKITALKSSRQPQAARALLTKLRDEGLTSFFRNANLGAKDVSVSSAGRRRLDTILRILARAGPWGVGFLAWEAFGPGIS